MGASSGAYFRTGAYGAPQAPPSSDRMTGASRFEVLQVHPGAGEKAGQWYWRRRNIANGEVLYLAEAFTERNDAVEAIRRAVRDFCLDAGISYATFRMLYLKNFYYYVKEFEYAECSVHPLFETEEQIAQTWYGREPFQTVEPNETAP